MNTQNTAIKGQSAKGTNVLDVLGNQKNLTPEQIKALQKKGKLKGDVGAFETLLKQNQTPTLAKQKLMNAQTMEQMNHNKTVLNQKTQLGHGMDMAQNHQVTPQGETKVARVLKLGQSTNLKTTQNNPNQGLEGVLKHQAQNHPQAQLKTHQSLTNVDKTTKAASAKKNNKLMDFNTFMTKQNASTRGRIAAKSAMYQAESAKSKSMFANKAEVNVPGAVKKQTQTNLQDIMFKQDGQTGFEQNMQQQNMNKNMMAQATGVGATAKVFDMASLTQPTNADAIIGQIQDYAIQARVGNEPQLEMSFQHQELGKVDLLIQKSQNDQLNISIGTNTVEGTQFFAKNQGELLQSLTQAGISVGDFKLDTGKSSSNQNMAGDFGRDQGQQQKEHGSESGQRQEDQTRRHELWEQFRDSEAA